MKDAGSWRPSKYVLRRGKLRASHDTAEVGVASRLVADLVATRYGAYLPEYARGRLVDLGCGKVPLYGAYRDLVETVTCVDWGNTLHPNSHLDCEASLSDPLPFGAAAFDTIVLSDVLEHIEEPRALWGEMTRVLAPGGCIVLNVPFLYRVHEAPHDYYRYTEFALRRFAEQTNLRVRVLDPVGGALDVAADTLGKIVSVIPLLGSLLARFIQWSAWQFGRTSFGERVRRSSATAFPLGYFVVAEKE